MTYPSPNAAPAPLRPPKHFTFRGLRPVPRVPQPLNRRAEPRLRSLAESGFPGGCKAGVKYPNHFTPQIRRPLYR